MPLMPDQFTSFGWKTGHVDLSDWDKSVVLGFGAVYDPDKNQWYLPIAPIYVETADGPKAIIKAAVTFKRPEPTQVEFDLPEIAVIRDDISPAPNRLQSPTVQYRLPAEGATPVSVGGEIGFNLYETKDKERPYDLVYTIECWSRYRAVAIMLLQMIMVAYPIRGSVNVVDGIGNERTYLTLQDGFADLTEVSSLVDRVAGYSLTLRVEAELTLDKVPTIVNGFTGGLTPTPVGPGGGTGPGSGGVPNPDLPAGGLYGDGLGTIRVTIMENEKS